MKMALLVEEMACRKTVLFYIRQKMRDFRKAKYE